jgi:DNA-binding MarR family transcriptional regulator
MRKLMLKSSQSVSVPGGLVPREERYRMAVDTDVVRIISTDRIRSEHEALLEPTLDTELDTALWSQLVAVHARVGGSVERTLQRRFGIGTSELQALIALAQSPDGELRMQELNDVTFLNQSSVSRMVARLERAGLAERRSCEQDRRGVFTGITDSGTKVLRAAMPVYEGSLRESFDQLAVDPKLRSLMHRLRQDEEQD